jgi:hypothetical protein
MCVWVWSSENKQPRHLLWVGRRGKDYDNKHNSYKLQKIIRLKIVENDNISTWGIKQHKAVRCMLWDITRVCPRLVAPGFPSSVNCPYDSHTVREWGYEIK